MIQYWDHAIIVDNFGYKKIHAFGVETFTGKIITICSSSKV